VAERHEDHDLGLIVALADEELAGAELATAESLVAACPECAALVLDLRALAAADRSLATAERPRDFRLTPADAARLAAPSEPVASGARLGGAMTYLPVDHPSHDPLLIAAAADGSLDPADQRRADAWLASCSACVALRDDLQLIAAANRAMPTPPRPRDYRLTPADADRAWGRGWRGFLARIGSSRDALSRPLAIGLTTLGLAGLLLSSGASIMPFGSAGSAQILSTVGAAIPEPNSKAPDRLEAPVATDGPGVFTGQGESAASAAPSAAAAAAPEAGGPIQVTGGDSQANGFIPAPTDAAAPSDDTTRALEMTGLDPSASEGPPAPVVISGLLLILGVGLFVLRWIARSRRTT
jgi:anti-sigma factor RsiW